MEKENISTHEIFMRRCLELARQAEGLTYPNPMVGAVVVYQNRIIGEGYHQKTGEPHAEVVAIKSVRNRELLKSSTLYVNLEPCAHYGKTPPCALLIRDEKIPKVVIGCVDTFSKVAGKGIEILKSGGVEVTVGILENECRNLNRRFFTYHEKKRPYIILKWAETEDGFIDIEREITYNGRPTWITGKEERRLVHKWRSCEQSILVGSVTALKDNPSLTVRDWDGKNPLRLLLDRDGKLPENYALFDGKVPTLIFTNNPKKSMKNVDYIAVSSDRNPIDVIMKTLYDKHIQSAIVEGGAKLLNKFISLGLWDEARVFIGNIRFEKGVKSPHIELKPCEFQKIGNSHLSIYCNNFVN